MRPLPSEPTSRHRPLLHAVAAAVAVATALLAAHAAAAPAARAEMPYCYSWWGSQCGTQTKCIGFGIERCETVYYYYGAPLP